MKHIVKSIYKTCLMLFLFRMVYNREMLHNNYFSTLIYNTPLGGSKKTKRDLKWIHELTYAGVNLLGININTIKKNRVGILDASKEVGLELNTDKTKHVSRNQTAGQNHNMKAANKSL
jgi:hypothetical protein